MRRPHFSVKRRGRGRVFLQLQRNAEPPRTRICLPEERGRFKRVLDGLAVVLRDSSIEDLEVLLWNVDQRMRTDGECELRRRVPEVHI